MMIKRGRKMNYIRNLKKDKNGAIMLEALIVYTITIFLLFLILAIFSVLFQRWNIQTIANESATRVAQTYRLIEADTSTGYVTSTQLTSVERYRYIFNNSAYEDSAKSKIREYASTRLKKTTFTKDVEEPEIDVKVIHDAMARRHIEVTITGKYSVPFGEAMAYFGFPGVIEYKTTAYADCVDMIDYINTIDFIDTQTSLGQFGSKTVGLVNAVLKLFDNIFGE